MGRTSTARDRMLDAACSLIRNQGYEGVGVAEVCSVADVRKGSFYHYFESKQALTREVINEQWRHERARWVAVLSAPGQPLTRLEALFGMHVDDIREQQDSNFINGCLFANLSLELSTRDAAIRSDLQSVFDDQIALVAEVLDDAVADGSLRVADTTAHLAAAMLAQLEGTILFAKLRNDASVLDGLWSQISRLVA
ncbi:TetR/AcrR family transcriptional regulator [Rhodococcus sp. BGS-1C]|jgi:TetR/AcrR family transcriptional repressor of nem operon|uniref:TetR/AcrR family transcriptional regulator n=1 Tax=Nocardiaceae TaxID=85025 RepID=UPI000965110A|nr:MULTISPECIES: TetR/AcrR family transcriptional regulator [Rhodococcus]MCZ4278940.1 TetR/AcrR family transcriptional regulator [Rhodococcus yunnanensis]OLT36415.1 TetR family transcriptional regulator [Rhodococcus sp. CUA-806]